MRNPIQFFRRTRVETLCGVLVCGLILGVVAPGNAAATSTYVIELAGGGTGTVISTPSGLNCSGTEGATTGECRYAGFPVLSSVELTAIPGPGSQFEDWSSTEPVGDCYSGTADPCIFEVDFFGEYTITAHFGAIGPQQPLEVKLTGAGGGAVTSSPGGIECGASCEAEFSEGSTVVLTAKETEHSIFAHWTGCSKVNAENKCEVTMSEAKIAEATFDAIPQQTLEVRKTGSGSGEVTSFPSGIECGVTCMNSFNEHSTVTLTAIPASAIPGTRYIFGGWTGCSNVTAEDKCEVTMSEAKIAEAQFDAVPQQTLKVQALGTGSGEVTSVPPGIRCGGACEAEFDEGATVVLTATPNSESVFAGWSGGGCAGSGPCEVTLALATTVTAIFEPVPSPTASTGEAMEITQTTARLSGIVDGQGFDSHYLFDYGETTNFGREAPSNGGIGEGAGNVSTNTRVTVEVSDLTPNDTYHYRIVAYDIPCSFPCPPSGPNTVDGGEQSFTTLPLIPAVTTDVPVTVLSSVALVGGEVVAQGAQTSYQVEYGATEALGSHTPLASAGSESAGVHVTATLEGLQPSTTYYYRVAASNAGGKEYGGIREFSTNASGEPSIGPLPGGFSLTGTAPTGPAANSFPNLSGLVPVPIPASSATSARMTKPKALSCEAKARRMKNAKKRKAVLKVCKGKPRRRRGM